MSAPSTSKPLTTFVVDSSVVLMWLHEEDDSQAARALAREELLAPPLLSLEVINLAARKWLWREEVLLELLRELERSGVYFEEPPLSGVIHWAALGLTAYDASYLALAESHECQLVTTDAEILRLAPDVATALSA